MTAHASRSRHRVRIPAVALTALAALLVFAGCAHRSGALDSGTVARIQPGTTSAEDVRSWLGEPGELSVRAEGGATWRYRDVSLAEPRAAGWWRSFRRGARRTGRAIGSWIYFPPRQPRAPRTEQVATQVRQLEIDFEPDGVVSSFAFERSEGETALLLD